MWQTKENPTIIRRDSRELRDLRDFRDSSSEKRNFVMTPSSVPESGEIGWLDREAFWVLDFFDDVVYGSRL